MSWCPAAWPASARAQGTCTQLWKRLAVSSLGAQPVPCLWLCPALGSMCAVLYPCCLLKDMALTCWAWGGDARAGSCAQQCPGGQEELPTGLITRHGATPSCWDLIWAVVINASEKWKPQVRCHLPVALMEGLFHFT